jgi:hypothetical protein
MRRWFGAVGAAVLVGCGGEGDGGDDQPLEEYACTQLATGELIDAVPDRAEARTLTIGRGAYRVNLIRDTVGYVAFETEGPADLTLVVDHPGAVPAWWEGDTRNELDAASPNPACETDLPQLSTLSTGGGVGALEVGPIAEGAIWLMLGE